MKPKPLPDAEALRAILQYDEQTGELKWRGRGRPQFDNRYKGRCAFTTDHPEGYKVGRIGGRYLLAHRVIWKIQTGEDPEIIDHLDGRKSNNRWGNLRSVTASENSRSQKRNSKNTSGVNGVYKRGDKFAAFGRQNGKKVWLGQFNTLEQAKAARQDHNRQSDRKRNHGQLTIDDLV